MKDIDSLVVYVLVWIAAALSTAVCLGVFFGIIARVARWVA